MDIKTYISRQLTKAIQCAGLIHARDIAWNAYLRASGAYDWYVVEHGHNMELWDWWDKEIRPEFLRLAGIQNI